METSIKTKATNKTFRHRQIEELEVIKSIYENDIEDLRNTIDGSCWNPLDIRIRLTTPRSGDSSMFVKNNHSFITRNGGGLDRLGMILFKLRSDLSSSEDANASTKLHVICSSKYPKVLPNIKLEDTKGLSESLVEELLSILQKKSMELRGNSMICELAETVQEFLFKNKKPPMSYNVNTSNSRLKIEFEQLKRLGRGAFGDVWKVRNILDNRVYAIKRIPLPAKNPELYKKMTREVKLQSGLNHDNVVRYFNSWIESASKDDMTGKDPLASESSESGESNEVTTPSTSDTDKYSLESLIGESTIGNSDSDSIQFAYSNGEIATYEEEYSDETGERTDSPGPTAQVMYIQMEYCENYTVRTAIDVGFFCECPQMVWQLFREIVQGLSYIHQQGIIHRDIKPANIFLDYRCRIKIGDFGLAKTISVLPSGLRNNAFKSYPLREKLGTGNVGTALYAAPELTTGTLLSTYDQSVDMYSLGIILFEMSQPAFETEMERTKTLMSLRTPAITIPEKMLKDPKYEKNVQSKVVNVFRRHGATEVHTPLLSPFCEKIDSWLNHPVKLLTSSGEVVVLPSDQRSIFARYIALNGINMLRRYSVDRIYSKDEDISTNSKEHYECAFDIITPNRGDLLIDAEILSVAYEITQEIPRLKEKNICVRINHTALLRSILIYCKVPQAMYANVFGIFLDNMEYRILAPQVYANLKAIPTTISCPLISLLLTDFIVGGPRNIEDEPAIKNLVHGETYLSGQVKRAISELQTFTTLVKSLGVTLVRWLLNHDRSSRPTTKELLASDLIPLVEPWKNEKVLEMLRHTLANSQDKAYQHLSYNCLRRTVNRQKSKNFACLESPNTALEFVKSKVVNVFRRHGATEVHTPLLSPFCEKIDSWLNHPVKLLTSSGEVVVLPSDQRSIFARYIALNGINMLRRYSVDRIYSKDEDISTNSKEHYECAFDIITPNRGDLLIDAEILSVAYEITQEIPRLKEKNICVRINHTALLRSILIYCKVPQAMYANVFGIFLDNMEYRILAPQVYANLKAIPTTISCPLISLLLTDFIVGGPRNIEDEPAIKNLVHGETYLSGQVKRAISELQTFTTLVKSLGVTCPIHIRAGLPISFERNYPGGIVWQLLGDIHPNISRSSVLAVGERYDTMLSRLPRERQQFSKSKKYRMCGAGFSLSLDSLVAAVGSESGEEYRAIEVAVCVPKDNNCNPEDVMCIMRGLWSAGIRSGIIEATDTDEADKLALKIGALHVIMMAENIFQRVRSRQRERFHDRYVARDKLVEYIKALLRNDNIVLDDFGAKRWPKVKIRFLMLHDKLSDDMQRLFEYQVKKQMANTFLQFRKNKFFTVLMVNLQSTVINAIVGAINPRDFDKMKSEQELNIVIERFPEQTRCISQVFVEIVDILSEKNSTSNPIVALYSMDDLYYRVIM